MAVSDPIADVLTKIRNASRARHATVDVRASKFADRILDVMKREGFIRMFKTIGTEPTEKFCRVYLKYAQKKPAIEQVVRISRPGVRVYRNSKSLPRVRRGLGVAIVTTSSGVMTEREAYQKKLGGEVVCFVW